MSNEDESHITPNTVEPSHNIISEIENFNRKKDDVFNNISLLNNLSQSLSASVQEEEKKLYNAKIKELVTHKQVKSQNEIELLKIENNKMEFYLDFLNRKHELELKYLEEMCEHKSRIEKLGDKYSHIDLNKFTSYSNVYKEEIRYTREVPREVPREAPRPPPPRPNISDNVSSPLTNTIPVPEMNTVASKVFPQAKNDINNRPQFPTRRESLQDHLEHALNSKFSSVLNNNYQNNSDDNSDFN